MPTRFIATICLIVMASDVGGAGADSGKSTALQITPSTFELHGKGSRQRILVTADAGGRAADVSREARFESADPAIVEVSGEGVCTPRDDGVTTVIATLGELRAEATVKVSGAGGFLPVTFERDVQPILARAGCNSGPCHGKASGQNGFKLSLLGFDDNFDYDALTKGARGRRVFPTAPEASLLVAKPTGQVPHGGGRRLEVGDANFETLLRWIEAGAPRDPADAPVLEHVSVDPPERIMGNEAGQQLLVTAHYSDGRAVDVTHLATFQSNESPIAAVDQNGLVQTGTIPGEAAIMARYQGKIATCTISIPLEGEVAADFYEQLPRYNFIDGHVWAKLQRLGITPSEPADDATFLRRAYLDAIGRLPAPAEVRGFLADEAPDKRVQLVDELLQRPEYADFWANKWVDLLRPNPYRVGIKAVLNLDNWVRDAFRQNMPYDQFVREIITAQGSTFRNGAATVFRDRRSPDEITTMTSQLFLGIRLECAKCHQHPFEVWSQNDFYSFAAYFARIGRKGTGLSPPISGSEEMVYATDRGEVRHPLSGEVMQPRPLFGEAPADDAADPREALAQWMTSETNPYFGQVIANRVWADLMGRGLVDPVDDLRATNPPSNGPLLEALAQDFTSKGCNLKELLRTIMTSYVYGLSAEPTERNVVDTRNYSRHYRQRLRAEVLLDAVCDITDVPEEFSAMPAGSRAMEIWTHRTGSLFLDTFGRPDPNQDPPCERTTDTSVVQALHLMNSEDVQRKVTSDEGRAARLAASEKTPAEIVEGLYLLVYSRVPTEEELSVAVGYYEKEPEARREITEDLLWALLNTPEFVFKN